MARDGMSNLLARLRPMVDDAGTAIFSDDELQTILDTRKQRVYKERLQYEVTSTGAGAAEYTLYHSHFGNYEEGGTVYFQIADSGGLQRGTADYDVDYANGVITMAADQHGTALYLSGWSYDLNGAASECWTQRAGLVSSHYNVNLDGHSLSRAQWFEHCEKMSELYARRAIPKRVRMWNNGLFER